MASNHHQHNHHCHFSSSSCCCSCSTLTYPCSSTTTTCHPLPPSTADPLLSLVIQLLQSTHHLPPPLPPPPPPPPQPFQYPFHRLPQKQPLPKTRYHQHPHQHQMGSSEEQAYIDSLIQRISALESSLSVPPSSPPPVPQQTTPPPPRHPNRVSLREVAARTIQSRFRLYLVRRSQTLRHLRVLAAIRSHLADLKSLAPSASVSQRAMDLLLHLDSIQSRDPMIREGKRSISEELKRILELASNGDVAKRRVLSVESMENMGFSQLQQHSMPLVKRVNFAGGGGGGKGSSSRASSGGADEEEVVMYEGGNSTEDDGHEVEQQGNGAEVSNAVLGHGRSNTRMLGPSSSPSHGHHKWIPQLGLYAPLPVQMESRRTALSNS